MSTDQKSQAPESVDFSQLVLGFSSAALHYMGVSPLPQDKGKAEKNLPLARQNISILEMLEDKTKGNLTSDEQKMLHHILGDLRVRFIDAAK